MVDYGRFPMANGSLPNRDPETGIRYGIVSLHDLNEYALESFEPVYILSCPECGYECGDDAPETCPECGWGAFPIRPIGMCRDSWCPDEPVAWTFEEDGYALELDEHNDVWIFKSPHTTSHWNHCSPCALGAAYLSDGHGEDHGEDLAYCPGPEWYDES